MKLDNIEDLIKGGGEICLGEPPYSNAGCVASACDTDQQLAMLVRRDGESLMELLKRLDAAVEDAYENYVFLDELND